MLTFSSLILLKGSIENKIFVFGSDVKRIVYFTSAVCNCSGRYCQSPFDWMTALRNNPQRRSAPNRFQSRTLQRIGVTAEISIIRGARSRFQKTLFKTRPKIDGDSPGG